MMPISFILLLIGIIAFSLLIAIEAYSIYKEKDTSFQFGVISELIKKDKKEIDEIIFISHAFWTFTNLMNETKFQVKIRTSKKDLILDISEKEYMNLKIGQSVQIMNQRKLIKL